MMTGNQLACATLERLGVKHIFGLPGSQNLGFFEALRASQIRTVLTSSETGAGFAANGYYRASGRVGVFTTIPGPGFMLALTPLAEARDDSAAVLYLVSAPAERRKFALQAVDQPAIAAPLVKRIFLVERAAELASVIADAYNLALGGEPGPVMVQIAKSLWSESGEDDQGSIATTARIKCLANSAEIETLLNLLVPSQRPVIYAGQGCNDAPIALIRLAERLGAPVVMTRSARGVIPMDHRLALAFDFNGNGAHQFNELLHASDLVLVLGCKLGHNGSAGFSLDFPREKLVHIDSSAEVLGANYPCRAQIQADVPAMLEQLVENITRIAERSCWADSLIAKFQEWESAEAGEQTIEPVLSGTTSKAVASFFRVLRNTLPADACVVTDTGTHQVLTTRYFKSMIPRGLIVPADFQSMGFGLPAAIGAKLALGDRPVIAIIGDGSIGMCGMELLTIAREKLRLLVVVFNDGALGQIRQQQLAQFGHAHASLLRCLSLQSLAEATGVKYFCLQGDAEGILRQAFETDGPALLEVVIRDSAEMKISAIKGRVRAEIRSKLNDSALLWLRNRRKARKAARKSSQDN